MRVYVVGRGPLVSMHRALTQGEVDSLRRRMHAGKIAYLSHHQAHNAAERLRDQTGQQVASYRCLFTTGITGEQPHFHVGHAPSLEGLERIADYLRFGVRRP